MSNSKIDTNPRLGVNEIDTDSRLGDKSMLWGRKKPKPKRKAIPQSIKDEVRKRDGNQCRACGFAGFAGVAPKFAFDSKLQTLNQNYNWLQREGAEFFSTW